MSESSQPSPLNTVVSKNVTLNITGSPLMRLYVHTSALLNGPKRLPLVIYYQHAGLDTSSVDFITNHDLCNAMARELNVVVALPSYRLTLEHRLQLAYQDGVTALEWFKYSEDEWVKTNTDLSNVYLMGTGFGGNVAYNVGIRVAHPAPLRIRGLILHQPFFGGEERCESEINRDLRRNDVSWKVYLPEGANRDHEYSNPTVGDRPGIMEVIGRWGWKVLVSGREGDPIIDRQKGVAKLMKEKGVDVVEAFTGANVPELPHLFGCITSIIHSSAP